MGWTGFPRAGRAAPWDFPRAAPSGNPLEQPCQSLENPVHPSSFTRINPVHLILSKMKQNWVVEVWLSKFVFCSSHYVSCNLNNDFNNTFYSYAAMIYDNLTWYMYSVPVYCVYIVYLYVYVVYI